MRVTHFECDRCGERVKVEQTVNDPSPAPKWLPVIVMREVIAELCMGCIEKLKAFCSRQEEVTRP